MSLSDLTCALKSYLFFREKKRTLRKCSNFFVLKYFFIKISVESDLLLKRTNLESIKSKRVHGEGTHRMTKISGRSCGKSNNLEMLDRQMTGDGCLSLWSDRVDPVWNKYAPNSCVLGGTSCRWDLGKRLQNAPASEWGTLQPDVTVRMSWERHVGGARDCHNHQSIVHHPLKTICADSESETLSCEKSKHCEIVMPMDLRYLFWKPCSPEQPNISRLFTFPDHERPEIFVIRRVVRYPPPNGPGWI